MIEIKTPTFPESIEEGTVARWHKQPGDPVNQDENIVDIETDKVVLEVPAPNSGILRVIHKQQGATVKSGEILAVIDTDASASVKPIEKLKTAAPAPAPTPTAPTVEAPTAKTGPAARRAAKLNQPLTTTAASQTPQLQIDIAGGRPQKRVAMSRIRARIAERLVEAQQTAAILTSFNEVNLQAVKNLREKHKENFEKTHNIKLGFMSFFVKAAVETLKQFPEVNASIDGQDIVYHGFYDIGIAVSTDRGLVVPVLRNADTMTLADIERTIDGYAKKARDNKLALEDMAGGTFTITNGGVFGSLLSTPIINPPQSAILGMHKIEERPVAENSQVVIRPMMYLALSYDHRLIDGKGAVKFLVTLKELLEDPSRLLLEI